MRISHIRFYFNDYNEVAGHADFAGGNLNGSVRLSNDLTAKVLELAANELQQAIQGAPSFGIQEVVQASLDFSGSNKDSAVLPE